MKLSTPTLLAILVSTAIVSAAPTAITSEQASGASLVKKSDISNALSIIEELGRLNQKRDLIDGVELEFDLAKRDNLLSELLTGLSQSGIIGDVWNIITTNDALKTEITLLVKLAIKGAITAAPSLITAIFNSGLLQTVFKDIWNSPLLRLALLSAAKAIFSSGLNLLKAFLAQKTGSTTATTAAAAPAATTTTTAAAAKREVGLPDLDEFYEKRDLISVAETVVQAIYNSGIVQNLVKKALADPTASISFLEAVFKNGLVVGKQVYSWAESSGLLLKGIAWISANGATYAGEIAKFIGLLIVSGQASTSDVDNATTAAVTTTATTSTATATTFVKRRLY
ncbi:hypothetical protein METSCH_C05860 [Metschnikowia aff. pulcherrima]|uniref:Opaque-phase-specific protein OP4 n=1 Tax=Metschnikowia aff. pulcherrima TaxID=2163413 RepID=A0A4P6XRR5_9ASCO|nr:hypothetical protein METSCH_C05860 [Metschnikowia aff. pulcherrima]